MSTIHSLTEGDATDLGKSLALILDLATGMAETGSPQGFRIYREARNALEILAFDRISRDTLARLARGQETFQGHVVSEAVLDHIRQGRTISAIKDFRDESGLGLKEAKDWVEAYMAHHNIAY